MEQKTSTSGSMKISENVIRTIVRTVLSEIDGVHSLASRTGEGSGWKSPVLSPVTVSLEADVAVIDIGINLCAGFRLRDVAEQNQIPWQTKNYTSGGNDASAIQRTREGVRVAAVSAPVRYLHTPSSVGCCQDFDHMYALAKHFLAAVAAQS